MYPKKQFSIFLSPKYLSESIPRNSEKCVLAITLRKELSINQNIRVSVTRKVARIGTTFFRHNADDIVAKFDAEVLKAKDLKNRKVKFIPAKKTLWWS